MPPPNSSKKANIQSPKSKSHSSSSPQKSPRSAKSPSKSPQKLRKNKASPCPTHSVPWSRHLPPLSPPAKSFPNSPAKKPAAIDQPHPSIPSRTAARDQPHPSIPSRTAAIDHQHPVDTLSHGCERPTTPHRYPLARLR